MALKEDSGGKPWYEWEPELVARNPTALARWRDKLAEQFASTSSSSTSSTSQMKALREAVPRRRIGLIGDMPIFVAHDSADVWARPDLFYLDERGPADGRGRGAAGLLQRDRPALGQPALPLGGATRRKASPGGSTG